MSRTPHSSGSATSADAGVVAQLSPRLPDDAFAVPHGVAAPPGYYLRQVLEAQNISQAQLALRTGLSNKHINQVVQGAAPLTPETALMLERAVGVSSRVWNDLESAHQDVQARERSHRKLVEYESWLRRFPTRELHQRNIVDVKRDVGQQVDQLLTFFQVADPAAYERVWSRPIASGFRRAAHLDVDPFATAAWLRLAEQHADRLELAPYDADRFGALLPTLRALTLLEDEDEPLLRLQQQCAAAGVAVVFTPEIKGARVSGAARWPRPTHPMIVLTGRFGWADSFWFSFFHEAAHIVLHPKRATYIHLLEEGDDSDGLETEANRAATRYLVGGALAKQLRPGLRHDDVRRISSDIGVDPGIVAGQLCRKLDDYVKYRALRRKIQLPPE